MVCQLEFSGTQDVGLFFKCWPSFGDLFDHHLWSIFQSSLHTLQITFSSWFTLCKRNTRYMLDDLFITGRKEMLYNQ